MKRLPLCLLCGIVLMLLLNACAGPAGKPVTEPLTLEEVETIVKKYPNFAVVYQDIIFPEVDRLPEHSFFRQKLKKLSYGEYMEFFNLVGNNDFEETLSREYAGKYNEAAITRRLDVVADSLVKVWEADYAQNGPESYAKFELEGITKKFVPDRWSGEKRVEVTARIRVTPLKGKIDKLSATFSMTKNEETFPLGDGKIAVNTPFEQPVAVDGGIRIFRAWYTDNTCESYFANTPANTIKQKAYFHISGVEVTVGDKLVNDKIFFDLRPYDAVFYQDERNNPDSEDFKRYREELAKMYIDRNYRENLEDYVQNRRMQELYKFSPLAFALFFGEDREEFYLEEWGKDFNK